MPKSLDIVVKPLKEEDLGEATRILRLAFGTFLGLPDPTQMFGDRQLIRNRWRANPGGVLGAYSEGTLVGSNVVTRWGKFGWFGPLSVLPRLWDKGIAKQLLDPTMDLFSKWQTTHEGLFTFAQSPKHVGLYEKFGFSARFLTVITTKKVRHQDIEYDTFSNYAKKKDMEEILRECHELTNRIYDGLDLSDEIGAVQNFKLGDTVLIKDGSKIGGFGVCHVGADTEAGSGTCFIKFGASNSKENFVHLLRACEDFASQRGMAIIEAGVNLGRFGAYREMLSQGFRSEFQGVAMQRPNQAGFNHSDVFAIDDWR
ncbi:MAG: GNAT family N-acetyltransferase [Nitrososphaerales archaeon]